MQSPKSTSRRPDGDAGLICAPSPDRAADAPADMYTPTQIRLLKVAVIGMGVILLLGFGLVIGRIVYLVNHSPRPGATISVQGIGGTPQGRPGTHQTADAALSRLDLPAGAIVRHIALSENRLAVYFDGPGSGGIRILDMATGQWSAVIPVSQQLSPPAP